MNEKSVNKIKYNLLDIDRIFLLYNLQRRIFIYIYKHLFIVRFLALIN